MPFPVSNLSIFEHVYLIIEYIESGKDIVYVLL